MHQATWSAGYDIRVDMQAKEKPVTLNYKGAITQSTGEVRTMVFSSSYSIYALVTVMGRRPLDA